MANIEKQQYWTQRHEDWQRSGLSQRAYCQREGLSFPSFDYWRRRTRASVHVVPTTALPQTTHQLTLVPVQLDVAPCRGDIHLRSPAGWHITLSATLDHTILSQLLSQLP
ncbi:hypothetical protein [Chitinimonas sp. BJB300]|nr:hypothetical protein [Chitinimonas sp. BJB300]TSJ82531.1 hypothetical protein FG002_022190 [Chitinimonas sp. BJB300]TSJ84537.1 hypothetical protein FG002_019550 [Chitinimonas sp. BJB300]TSJ89658.1 hypothetical protein FG002_005395 [Chitinimonas sp. BJB300]